MTGPVRLKWDEPAPADLFERLEPQPRWLTEWGVLCPSDKKIRSESVSQEEATSRATGRDKNCGCCRPHHGAHVVVTRTVTTWQPPQ